MTLTGHRPEARSTAAPQAGGHRTGALGDAQLDALRAHADRLALRPLPELSAAAPPPVDAPGWAVDTARQRLDADARSLLRTSLAPAMEAAVRDMFSGRIVNPAENRAALHWALRAGDRALDGPPEQAASSVRRALDHAQDLRGRCEAILHIGIGGSDLGPRLVADALEPFREPGGPVLRFASSVDPGDLDRAAAGLDLSKTHIIAVSKSFGTEETLYNLDRAAGLGAGGLTLVTADRKRAQSWAATRALSPEWLDLPLEVGGRFSLWSAVSCGVMARLGREVFEAFLHGARAMDETVLERRAAANPAARLALLDWWNAVVLERPMRVVLAYGRGLRLLPLWLQQLEMESLGKSAGADGLARPLALAPAVWGSEGPAGQHSFHQWLHQGRGGAGAPTEFVVALPGAAALEGDAKALEGRARLAAHALAQSETLAHGRPLEAVEAAEPALPPALAAQKVHPGGRASSLLLCADFGPEALGALLALYEHRTVMLAAAMGINPFDQWGVEAGKRAATGIREALEGGGDAGEGSAALADPVTRRAAEALGF